MKYKIGISFVLCGFSKFILDFFRESHIEKIISLNQIISIVFIFIGIVLLNIKENKNKKV